MAGCLFAKPYHYISNKFWDEYIWLMPNITWQDVASQESRGNIKRAHAGTNDLVIPILLALGLIALRYACEKYCFTPIGRGLGITDKKRRKAKENPVLEEVYASQKHPSHRKIVAICKQIDFTERQVDRWFRIRRNQDKPSTLVKFCETQWRFYYYLTALIYGTIVLWDKPWLWDINYVWYGFPHQGVEYDIWWYYMISLAFYWSLMFSQFFDVKRKDFWQMFVHHCITIILISFSWICNFHRIGSLVLLVHDCADTLLEFAKSIKYANWNRLCDYLFVIFTITWIGTRLIIFPLWIIRNIAYEAPRILPMFPVYYIFTTLLIALLGLHCFWTYYIMKIAYGAIVSGKIEGDARSSSSLSSGGNSSINNSDHNSSTEKVD